MIAGCPTCGARYRMDVAKLRPEGTRVRCARCETVFRVRPSPEISPAPSSQVAESAARDRTRLVLIATADPESGKRLAQRLESWGLSAILVHDGVEAILGIQRALPRAVVLDADLPRMTGLEVCELIKRNESLRLIAVALVRTASGRQRSRSLEERFGADAYLDGRDVPDALQSVLERFGLPLTAPQVAPPPAPASAGPTDDSASLQPTISPEPPPPTPPSTVPVPAAAAPPDDALATAERLARIIVSDIVLYNQEKFEAGLKSGDVAELLASELSEGCALFRQRVDPQIGEPSAFLEEELQRVVDLRRSD